MLNDNSPLLFLAVLIVVAVLWVSYKIYMTRFWQQKRGSAAAIPASQRMDTRPIEYTVLDAQQTTKRLSLIYAFTRRAKFFIMGGISTLLALVYILAPVGDWPQELFRLIISVFILGGLAIGLSYWHSWAEQKQRTIAR